MKPKLCDLEKNAGIILEFESFLRNLKFDTSSNGSDLSTIRKVKGHLFHYEDSLLQFQSKTTPHYNLERHFTPMAEDFLEVTDPTCSHGWLQSIAGPSGKDLPGRRKEMLKSHARWRDFVLEKLTRADFGSSADGLYKREISIKNLDQIANRIKKKQVFSQLSNLENQLRSQKQKARAIVYPSNNFQEQQSVKQWFMSEEAKEEERFCMKVYDKSLSGSRIGPKDFSRFANWARFSLVLEDRNRRSVYNFSNRDFMERTPKWLPEMIQEDDVDNVVDRFEMLPKDWDADTPHKEDEDPSCWVIQVCGSSKGLKGGRPAQIVMTPRSYEICLKYRDLKSEMIEKVSESDQFFVNIKNKPLTSVQRTPGSLLYKLGVACGIYNATVNTFRRAAEVRVQASPLMKASVENLQSHSGRVGLQHYDKSGENTRATFIQQLSAMDSPQKADLEVPDAVKIKRQKKEEEEREEILKKAKETLARDKLNKKEELSKKCKLKPEDRKFLQKLFASEEVKELGSQETFPGKNINC